MSKIGTKEVYLTFFGWFSLISQTCIIYADGQPGQPPSTQNQQSQPSRGGSDFGDSSGPLFSMYSKIAEEEDNRMTDRWTKDADGILIFVSHHITNHTTL